MRHAHLVRAALMLLAWAIMVGLVTLWSGFAVIFVAAFVLYVLRDGYRRDRARDRGDRQ